MSRTIYRPQTDEKLSIIRATLDRQPTFVVLDEILKHEIVQNTLSAIDRLTTDPANILRSTHDLTPNKLLTTVMVEFVLQNGTNIEDNDQLITDLIKTTKPVTPETMDEYIELVAHLAHLPAPEYTGPYDIKLNIESWRLDLQLPSTGTGLALELNGRLEPTSLNLPREFGNLSLCSRSDVRRFRSINDPGQVPFGYLGATFNDGYIICEHDQIMAMVELLKTNTRIYLTIVVSDCDSGGYMIERFKAYSHT